MDINKIIEFIGAYQVDELLISLYKDAVVEELKGLIPNFDEKNLTARQKLLMLTFIQDFYDNRDLFEDRKNYVRNNFSSMLLNERYKGINNEV